MGPQGPAGTAQGPIGPVGPAGPPGPQGPPGTGSGGGIADAPSDGTTYARKSAAWVHLTHSDITDWTATLAPYAPLASPALTGTPTAPTVTPGTDNSTKIATTGFVQSAISAVSSGVTAITAGAGLTGGGSGAVTLAVATNGVTNALAAQMPTATLKGNSTGATANASDLTVAAVMTMLGAAPLASPTFTGTPSLPTGTTGITQTAGNNSTALATTAFVAASFLTSASASATYAPLASPTFTGTPSLPTGTTGVTQPPSQNDTKLATTGFVKSIGYAPLASPTFTGTVTIPAGASISGFAPLASPTFTGAPNLPTGTVGVTQTAGNSSTALATTAFVATSFLPLAGGTLTGGLVVQAPVDLKVQTVTQSGATLSINRSLGENCTLTTTASITSVAVSNWPASGVTGKVRLVIVNGGAYTITGWPAGTKWPGGTAPTITASGTDIVLLMTDNGGTTIYGSVVGQGYA